MISVAAELAEMHPQTLRMYEERGLIKPQRSPKGTRLYSQEDVDRLRRIQELTGELGMNLAGVERVFELEDQLERMSGACEALEERAEALQAEMATELEEVRRSFRAELVRYEAPGTALVPVRACGAAAPGRCSAPQARARRHVDGRSGPAGRRCSHARLSGVAATAAVAAAVAAGAAVVPAPAGPAVVVAAPRGRCGRRRLRGCRGGRRADVAAVVLGVVAPAAAVAGGSRGGAAVAVVGVAAGAAVVVTARSWRRSSRRRWARGAPSGG